jgi:fibronectin type 3 domain-containing protein
VGLAWTAAPDAVSYRVYRDGALLGTTTDTTYTDTAVALDQHYRYTVSSINVEGDESAQSNPALADTPSPTLIDTHSTWKYTDDGVNRGTAWKEPAYDDTTWRAGGGSSATATGTSSPS